MGGPHGRHTAEPDLHRYARIWVAILGGEMVAVALGVQALVLYVALAVIAVSALRRRRR